MYLHLAVQNLNDRTMMKASPRVATVEEFYSILEQGHSNGCQHAGSKKTFANVYTFSMFLICLYTCMFLEVW